MEIKDLEEGSKIKYSDLDANVFDNGRLFCATSYDGKWCCIGVIIDWYENISNSDPNLRVNIIYKRR